MRLLAGLGLEHDVARVLTWEGTLPEAEPRTRYVEGVPGSVWSAWAVRQEVRAFDPDVVLVDGPLPPPSRRPSLAFVRDLTLTGWEDVPDPRGLLLHRFGRVVVPSALVRRQVAQFGVDPFRVHVVPEALPTCEPLPSPDGREGPVVLAQIGAIHPAKRPHLAIDAVARLTPAEKGRVRLVVAGPVRDARYLAQLRVQAEGQPVELLPDPPTLLPTLARASGVLYPTAVDEGWPDAAILALCTGRPVWFSDRPSLRDALLGFGVPVRDEVDAWRSAVRSTLGGLLPAVDRDALLRRYGPAEHRRRWREALTLATR